jgi:hypothetical protein
MEHATIKVRCDCGAELGVVHGDVFRSKGFGVTAQSAANITPPIPLRALAHPTNPVEPVLFPCAGRDHHSVAGPDIYRRVMYARRYSRRSVRCAPFARP